MSQTKAQLLGPVLGTVEYAGDVNFDSGTLFVDSANNKVGIGTTNPSEQLHLNYNGNNGVTFRIENFEGATKIINDAGGVYIDSGEHNFRSADGSTQRLRITSDGNVGIGTANPASKLHVVSGSVGSGISSFGTAIRINGEYGTPNSNHGIGFSINGNSPAAGIYVTEFNGAGANLRFATSTSYTSPSQVVAMSITSTGNVGIGTINPSSPLVVESTTNSNYNSNSVTFSVDIKNLADYVTYPSSTAGIRLFAGNASSGGGVIAGVRVGPSNQGDIVLAPTDATGSAVEKFRVTSGGNVGIGTTNPLSTLHVQGTLRSTSQTFLAIGETTTLMYIGDPFSTNTRTILFNRPDGVVTGNVNIQGVNAGVGYTNFSMQAQGGSIGIGTTNPQRKLHVHAPGNDLSVIRLSGSAVLETQYDIRQGIVGISNAGFSIYDINATTTRFVIDSAGNIGIGTGNPSYTMDVYGTFRSKGTSAPYRYAEINSIGRILSNLANNGNETNLILDNVGDSTSTTGHGSNILFRTNDNNSATTAIDSGRISITKTQQWTSTTSTRNSSLEISLSKGGSLQQRLTINSADARATFFVRQRSNSASEDTSLANHQYLFVEPDGGGPAYYRRSLVSEYKGFNQYSYWAIRYDGASYDYTGSLKCRITWSTAHASGAGFAEFSLAVRSGDSDGGPAPAGNVIQYGAVQFSNGWFYPWTVNPDFDVYYAGFNENKQFLVLRLNGYMNHNGGTYDGGVHETVDLESWGNAFQGIYRIGTSAPSGFTLNAITKTILT